MAYIRDLILPCHFPNIVNLCWSINITHLLEAERPKVTIGIRVFGLVLPAVLAAPLVANPDVIALSRELECRSNRMLVDHPAISGGQESMLHENSRLFGPHVYVIK
jgi:hypothetical protein